MPMITEKYAKLILQKVSFDKNLFEKEFKKILLWLHEPERRKIIKWVRSEYPIEFSRVDEISTV